MFKKQDRKFQSTYKREIDLDKNGQHGQNQTLDKIRHWTNLKYWTMRPELDNLEKNDK